MDGWIDGWMDGVIKIIWSSDGHPTTLTLMERNVSNKSRKQSQTVGEGRVARKDKNGAKVSFQAQAE